MSLGVAKFKKYIMKIKRPINLVLPYALEIQEHLKPYCEQIEILGSIRRGKELVGDIEFIIIPKCNLVPNTAQRSFFDEPVMVEKVIPQFFHALSSYKIVKGGFENGGKLVQFMAPRRISVDAFRANAQNYGYIKVLRTGPHEHNVGFIIPMLKMKGYELSDGYVKYHDKIIPIYEEEDLYRIIEIDVIPPDERQFVTKVKNTTYGFNND